MVKHEEALRRLRTYVQMRDEKPIAQLDDRIHAIHGGTQWEGEVRLSDLRVLLAEVDKSPEVDARDPIEKARDTLTETTRALKMIRLYCEVHSSPWDVAACKRAEAIIRSLPMYRSEPQSSEDK